MTDSENAALAAYEEALQRASAALAAHDTATAFAALDDALVAQPGSAVPHFLRAAEFARTGRIDDAENAFTLALVQDPSLHIARFQLGLLHLTSGKPAHAILAWQGLDSLPETHALRLFAKGLAQLAQDRFDEARDALERGMRANTDNAALNEDMGKVIEKIAALTSEQRGAEEPSESNHFLVSGYGKQTLH